MPERLQPSQEILSPVVDNGALAAEFILQGDVLGTIIQIPRGLHMDARMLYKGAPNNTAQRLGLWITGENLPVFIAGTLEEQEKAEACKRLIQNAIILWNYLYLSKKVVDEPDREKQKQILTTIQSGSIVTWAHIHLHGEFDFSERKLRDSVGFDMSQILALKISEKWDMGKVQFSLN